MTTSWSSSSLTASTPIRSTERMARISLSTTSSANFDRTKQNRSQPNQNYSSCKRAEVSCREVLHAHFRDLCSSRDLLSHSHSSLFFCCRLLRGLFSARRQRHSEPRRAAAIATARQQLAATAAAAAASGSAATGSAACSVAAAAATCLEQQPVASTSSPSHHHHQVSSVRLTAAGLCRHSQRVRLPLCLQLCAGLHLMDEHSVGQLVHHGAGDCVALLLADHASRSVEITHGAILFASWSLPCSPSLTLLLCCPCLFSPHAQVTSYCASIMLCPSRTKWSNDTEVCIRSANECEQATAAAAFTCPCSLGSLSSSPRSSLFLQLRSPLLPTR